MIIGNFEADICDYIEIDNCPCCNKMSELHIAVTQKTFVMGLFPLFPHNKLLKVKCDTCNAKVKAIDLPDDIKTKAFQKLKETKFLRRSYAGSVFLAIILFVAFIMISKDQNEMKAMIDDPLPGDIYVIEYEDPNAVFYATRYTLWKLDYTDDTFLFFSESNFEVDDHEDISMMLHQRESAVWYYSDYHFTKTHLKEMTSISAEEYNYRVEDIVRSKY